MDTSRVTFERRPRAAFENSVFSKKLADPKQGETGLLVTSAATMPRAIGAFYGVGWDVRPWPVSFKTGDRSDQTLGGRIALTDAALDEGFGLVVYRVLGRTQELFPATAP